MEDGAANGVQRHFFSLVVGASRMGFVGGVPTRQKGEFFGWNFARIDKRETGVGGGGIHSRKSAVRGVTNSIPVPSELNPPLP